MCIGQWRNWLAHLTDNQEVPSSSLGCPTTVLYNKNTYSNSLEHQFWDLITLRKGILIFGMWPNWLRCQIWDLEDADSSSVIPTYKR